MAGNSQIGYGMLTASQQAVDPQTGLLTRITQAFLERIFKSAGAGLAIGGPAQAITVGASPYTYTAPLYGSVVISGGTVSAVALSRDGSTFIATGQTAGQFVLTVGDQLKITHTGAPTATFVPR